MQKRTNFKAITLEYISFAYSQVLSKQRGFGAGIWIHTFFYLLKRSSLLTGSILAKKKKPMLNIFEAKNHAYVAIPKASKLYLFKI